MRKTFVLVVDIQDDKMLIYRSPCKSFLEAKTLISVDNPIEIDLNKDKDFTTIYSFAAMLVNGD